MTVIYFKDLRQDIVQVLYDGQTTDKRLKAVTGICKLNWFTRVWTAMEYVRSSQVMAIDGEGNVCSTWNDPVFIKKMLWFKEARKHKYHNNPQTQPFFFLHPFHTYILFDLFDSYLAFLGSFTNRFKFIEIQNPSFIQPCSISSPLSLVKDLIVEPLSVATSLLNKSRGFRLTILSKGESATLGLTNVFVYSKIGLSPNSYSYNSRNCIGPFVDCRSRSSNRSRLRSSTNS